MPASRVDVRERPVSGVAGQAPRKGELPLPGAMTSTFEPLKGGVPSPQSMV